MSKVKIALIIVGVLVVIGIIANVGKSRVPASASSTAPASTATSAAPWPSQAPVAAAPAPAAPAAPAGPATEASAGTYEVGVDLAAGRYKTPGPGSKEVLDSCYYARRKDDSGNLSAVIANQIVQGPSTVTIKKGEFLELSGGCTWTKQ